MNITVVNKRTALLVPPNTVRVYIGRPSPLGNPFTHIHDRKTKAEYIVASRDEAVRRYEGWLRKQIAEASPIYGKIGDLVSILLDGFDLELECWCAPKSCHGDIIKKVILEDDWLNK